MWLLESTVKKAIEDALVSNFNLSAEQKDSLVASGAVGQEMSVQGQTAVIPIRGVLTQERDWLAAWFGGGNTLYSDIAGGIAEANQDARVKDIVLDVSTSPGGSVSGLYPMMDAIENSEKPICTSVRDSAASATFMAISQTSEIVAEHKGVRVGGVGVVVSHNVNENVKEIASEKAPLKRPDVSTPEGVKAVQGHLNDVHALYVGRVAKGRGTTVAKVNSDFGRGGMMLAEDALKNGMIDKIGSIKTKTAVNTKGGKQEARHMDVNQLRAEHPEVYAAAVQKGIDQERDRVGAHLTFGEKTGAMEIAVKAVKDGQGMTATLQAEYLTEGLKLKDIGARDADNPDVGTTPAPKDDKVNKGEQVAMLVGEMLGLDPDEGGAK